MGKVKCTRRAKSGKPISGLSKQRLSARDQTRFTEQRGGLDFVKTHENKGITVDVEFFRNGRLRICHMRKRQAFLRDVIEVIKTVVTSSQPFFRPELRLPNLQSGKTSSRQYPNPIAYESHASWDSYAFQ